MLSYELEKKIKHVGNHCLKKKVKHDRNMQRADKCKSNLHPNKVPAPPPPLQIPYQTFCRCFWRTDAQKISRQCAELASTSNTKTRREQTSWCRHWATTSRRHLDIRGDKCFLVVCDFPSCALFSPRCGMRIKTVSPKTFQMFAFLGAYKWLAPSPLRFDRYLPEE